MDRLFELDLARQGWFVLIHYGFHHGRTIVLQSFPKHAFSILWIMNGETRSARSLRELREVDRLKIYAEFGVSIEDHLLPFDLSQRIVLDDNHFTGSLYLTNVAISPMSIVNPPSPTTQTTCRPGYATAAPML